MIRGKLGDSELIFNSARDFRNRFWNGDIVSAKHVLRIANYTLMRFLPIAAYFVGMMAMFLSDILVSKIGSIEQISDWAATKSAVLLGVSIVLFGQDQVIVREHRASMSIFNGHIPFLIAASFLVSAVTSSIIEQIEVIPLTLAIASLAFVSTSFGTVRANLQMLNAQLINNGWKLFVLIVLTTIIVRSDFKSFEWLFFGSAFVVISISYLLKKLPYSTLNDEVVLQTNERIRYGFLFFLSSTSLVLALYAEQLLLNAGGYSKESAIYFAHATLVLPPIIFFNGYFGFWLSTYAAKRPEVVEHFISAHWGKMIIVAVALPTAAVVFASSAYHLIFPPNISFSYPIAVAIAAVGLFRLAYSIPSGYVGMLSDMKTLKLLVFSNVLSSALLVIVYLSSLSVWNDPIKSIIAGAFSCWTLKVLFGYYLTLSTARNRSSNLS